MNAIIKSENNTFISANIEINKSEEFLLFKESLEESIHAKKNKLKTCSKYLPEADEEEEKFLKETQERISREIILLLEMIDRLEYK
ncbi:MULTISPECIES: hypothetical protein [Clostridium]|uniref:hypothetical protein n=1 Tax=Clostridium TaxID=1485 RepID=UPI002901AF79|nr:hypothetical protein [Clostridium sp.]MDU1587021.1 hypothetical protein [Clostridium sp.]